MPTIQQYPSTPTHYGRLSAPYRYAGITVTEVIWRKYLCRSNQVTNLRVRSACVKVDSGLE